jgi:phosphatidylglycerophosphate synthase
MPFGTRSDRGRVVAAASPYHAAGDWDGVFLGALKVGARDRAPLIEAAESLADLAEPPLPGAWEDELRRKEAMWRLWLARRESRAADGTDDAPIDVDPATVELSDDHERELRRRMSAATPDVASLLLVGLVRGGAHVTNSYLRSFFWARVLSSEAAEQARHDIAGYDEDRLLLDAAVKPFDGFFTTFFVSPYSKYVARWAARRGWTPNFVTTLSMGVGALSAAAFATGERAGLVAGAVLLQLAFTLDCVDGQLARYTRTFSRLGAWLDSVFDRGKEYLVFAGLAIGSSRGFGDDVWALAAAALTLQTARHTLNFSFAATQQGVLATARHLPLETPSENAAREAEPAAPGHADGASPPRPRRIARRALRALRALDELTWTRWPRKIIAFPIGERFAVVSATAAVFTPRTTFVVLLAWGGFAAAYAAIGRLLRSLAERARRTAAEIRQASSTLLLYRDDGPLARALGRTLGTRVGIPSAAALIAGAAPLVAVLAAEGDGSPAALAGAVGWLVLLGGLSRGRPHGGRLGWAAPPLLRVVEYGALLWFAVLSGGTAVPACFALLAALAFRHYDAVYRLRHRGDSGAASWVHDLGGGWDGRLVLACVLFLAGALAPGLYVAAALVAVLSVAESAASWLRSSRTERPAMYVDDEGENE